MSLLQEIQTAVIQEGTEIGPILLKLKLLAARLGSGPLEAWVKHESEGYSDGSDIPDYRKIGVSYKGSFAGPYGGGVQNAPIPPYIIEKYGGKSWTNFEIRQSISAVDDLIKASSGGLFEIPAANLILLLQGNIYPDYNCYAVTGTVSRAALVEIQHAVRARILELTLGFEKSIPGAANITLAAGATTLQVNQDRITQITHQVIYGNVTSITSTGDGTVITVAVQQGDQKSFVDALVQAGMERTDAAELGQIVASEKPQSKQEPFGAMAIDWLGKNLKKAGKETWKMGFAVATEVIKEAALRYYGMK